MREEEEEGGREGAGWRGGGGDRPLFRLCRRQEGKLNHSLLFDLLLTLHRNHLFLLPFLLLLLLLLVA
jgi:hypothetical protein